MQYRGPGIRDHRSFAKRLQARLCCGGNHHQFTFPACADSFDILHIQLALMVEEPKDDFDRTFSPANNEGTEHSSPKNASVPGMISFGLGIALIMSVVIAISAGNTGDDGTVLFSVFFSVVFNISGLVAGIIGLTQKGRSRGLALTGTIINGLFLLAFIVFIFYMASSFGAPRQQP